MCSAVQNCKKTKFWDCNIITTPKELGYARDIIQECLKFGYHGIILNHQIRLDNSTHSFITSIIDHEQDYKHIKQLFSNAIHIKLRLTFKFPSLNSSLNYQSFIDRFLKNAQNNEINKNKFDIISCSPMNVSQFIQACEEWTAVNIINLDEMQQMLTANTSIKNAIRKAKHSGKYFEITVNAITSAWKDSHKEKNGGKNMRYILSCMNLIMEIIGYKNIIFSSGSNEILQCRTPLDLMSIGNLFAFKKHNLHHRCIDGNVNELISVLNVRNNSCFPNGVQCFGNVSDIKNDLNVDDNQMLPNDECKEVKMDANVMVEENVVGNILDAKSNVILKSVKNENRTFSNIRELEKKIVIKKKWKNHSYMKVSKKKRKSFKSFRSRFYNKS